jgi:hypothetical protein
VRTFTRSPSEESTSLLHVKRTGLLIGGRWRPAASGATFRVYNPATGAVIAEVADAAPQHTEDAVAAAPAVAANWAAAPPREPSEILRRTWQLTDRADDLSALITLETARPRPTRDRRSATPGVHRNHLPGGELVTSSELAECAKKPSRAAQKQRRNGRAKSCE